MTDRLYYHDSYTRSFTARIVERLQAGERPAVVLDRTYFYPTSGGQPHDRGSLNGVSVVDVAVRPGDGAVVHALGGEVEADEVRAEIDWPRRFDHMQQHTGQHILSQAFLRAANADTVAFHLSENSVTIDVAGGLPAAESVEAAETLANQVVMDDAPVRAWFPAEAELETVALRRTPEGIAPGALRVVAIGEFDYNACGGTHIARTGEIGAIKIVKVETFRRNGSKGRAGDARVEFRCGWRALRDYRRKNEIVNALAAGFTCGPDEVPDAVARLQTESQAARHAFKAAQDELLDHEAVSLAEAGRTLNGWRIVRQAWEGRGAPELRALAGRLAGRANTVALLGSSGPQSQVVLARAEGLAPDMRELLKVALNALGSGRGGGSPALAQGGGPAADRAQVESALDAAERVLLQGT